MTERVLFLCPHGAAKSVLAAAYFQRRAQELGLSVEVGCAGTEPDDQIAPAVAELLAREGMPAPLERPRRVSVALIADATRAISLGCQLDDLPARPVRWEAWDDLPLPSQDLPGAWAAIRRRVDGLAAELAAARPNIG